MIVLGSGKQEANVTLSYDEVGLLNNALNEVCNAFDIAEFSTRMGANMSEVQGLLRQLNALGKVMQDNGATWSN